MIINDFNQNSHLPKSVLPRFPGRSFQSLSETWLQKLTIISYISSFWKNTLRAKEAKLSLIPTEIQSTNAFPVHFWLPHFYFQSICSWRESCCQDCCDFFYEPVVVLFSAYLSCFPKKRGHTIKWMCFCLCLHLLKLSFFPYRVSKSSSQMKWCYFMLKVKEKFYRQINFKLFLIYHSLKTLTYVNNAAWCKVLKLFPSHEILRLRSCSQWHRGYGFVKFGDESEQKKALEEFQNATGLGGKAIRISIAVNKR